MDNYKIFLDMGIITRKKLEEKVGNIRTADSMIYRAVKNELIIPIKKNFYVVKNLETNQSLLNKFEIASHITPTACVSNYSAFEYYGLQNQVFQEIFVTTKTKFEPFTFENISYQCFINTFTEGIDSQGKHIRVTTLERTLVDAINNLEKIAGLEELLYNLQGINNLDFGKIQKFLDYYNKQFLFQKVGFFLDLFQSQFSTPQNFITFCLKRIGKSIRYLEINRSFDILEYNNKWQLYVPKNIRNYLVDEWNNSPRAW